MAIATLALASAALAATFSRLRTGMARLITTLTLASTVLIIQTPCWRSPSISSHFT